MSKINWTIVVIVALVVLLGVSLLGGRGYGGWGMMGPGMMGGWGGLPFMGPVFGLVFICLIIGGVVWLVQSRSREESRLGSGPTATETPLEILKRRYASGEVTKEQLEDMRRTLNS